LCAGTLQPEELTEPSTPTGGFWLFSGCSWDPGSPECPNCQRWDADDFFWRQQAVAAGLLALPECPSS